MKKMLSLAAVLALALSLAAAIPVVSDAGHIIGLPVEDGFEYLIHADRGTALITDYYGSDADLVIPGTIAGYTVTGIDIHAFAHGDFSFITGLTFPASLTYISRDVFGIFPELASITVEEGNPAYHSEGNCLIENETKTLILGCQNSVIPEDGSVTVIGETAFIGCTGLSSINIPDTVTRIEYYAFGGCTGLSDINIPGSVEIIEDDAFAGCTGLTRLVIPEGVIGVSGFTGCTNLADISLPDSLLWLTANAFHDTAWYEAQPNGVVYLDGWAYAYKNTHDPKRVELREGTVGIASGAFAYSPHLEFVTLPDGLKIIGAGAFTGCVMLETLTLPDSVTTIGECAFERTALTEITLPKSLTSLGECAFEKTLLTALVFPKNLTDIGKSPALWCDPLTSLAVEEGNPVYHSDGNCVIETATGTLVLGCQSSVIPQDGSIKAIGAGAFSGCRGLTAVTIPDGVTEIGDGAFWACNDLKSVRLPDGLVRIGYEAFGSCDQLKSVTIPDSVTAIGGRAFESCDSLMKVTLPAGLTVISDSAFYHCLSLTSVTIPEGVTEIGYGAFDDCNALTRVYFPSTLTRIDMYAFNRFASLSLQTVWYGGTEADREAIEIVQPDSQTMLMGAAWVYEAAGLPVVSGDANGDGELNMKDVLCAREFIAGLSDAVYEAAADANADNSVDMKDVLTMRKMIAGLLPVSD